MTIAELKENALRGLIEISRDPEIRKKEEEIRKLCDDIFLACLSEKPTQKDGDTIVIDKNNAFQFEVSNDH